MWLFAVTFSVVGVLTGLEAVCRRLVLLWLLYFGMVDQIRIAVGMGEEMELLWLLYFGMVDQIRIAVGMGEEMELEG